MASPHSNLETLATQFASTGRAAEVLAARTQAVDEIIAAGFRDKLAAEFPEGLALLAVGGYGRRELFPYSDIDLLLLVSRDIKGDALSAFLRELWDSGLRLSQSVRTVSECCEIHQGNIELSVSLIDQRFLTGDQALYEQLAARLPRFFRAQRSTLIRHLCQMSRSRHARYQNTIYHLEPNIKETPGGMRDLHLVHWLAQLRGAEESPEQLAASREFLSALRCRLHFKAGRDHNFLTFDEQDSIAEDTAAWMRDYYRHARSINRAALRELESAEVLTEGGLIQTFRDWRTRLTNAEFSVHRERLFFRAPQQLQWDPDVALRFFQFVARHNIRPSVEADRRIGESLSHLRQHWSAERRTWPGFRDLLSQPHAAAGLRAMHECGVLLALFPEWEEIECLVVRDFYHRYTVDEHTLLAIESLERLRASKDAARRRFIDLLSETEDIPLLYMALLFHDTGKGNGHTGHAEASSALARDVLIRMQTPAPELARIRYLIERHLELSATMNSRDLNDPATARDVAGRVGTIENLKLLTLLTYADISAVNPEAMTSWRLEQLWRLYSVVAHELTRELDTDRIHVEQGQSAFLEGLPARYLRTHDEEEIEAHRKLATQASESGVAVDLQRKAGAYVATIATQDHPNLLASLAGMLSSFGMDILKAEAFANRDGMVLDTFAFADPMRTLELNPPEFERLKLMLQRAALGKEDVRKLLKGRVRHVPKARQEQIRTSVSFDNTASQTATLVELVAEDRPGLLYEVADTFSAAGYSIDVVLIDTEAHKAIDTFYVTEAGAKLTEAAQHKLRAALLAVCSASKM